MNLHKSRMPYRILILCLAALASGLFFTDAWLGFRNHRYSQLIAKHECGYSPKPACKADFDGDGRFTQIKIQYRHDAPVELPSRFSGTEAEIVLHTFYMDNTFRTHIATARESDRDRLLVYEGVTWPGKKDATNAVYAHNGNQLIETSPTRVDKEILAAMASRDDAGSWGRWVAYSLLAWPVRLIYTVLFVIVALLYRSGRQFQPGEITLTP